MTYFFPFDLEFPPLNVPENNLQGIFEYPKSNETDDIHRTLKSALEKPIGSPKLEELAKGKKFAIIIVDDLSRNIPVKQIIPDLCDLLKEIGVKTIKILIAMGAQKPLTPQEKKEKFGAYIFDKYDIINHRFKDHLDLSDLGYNSFGSRVYVNNRLSEADLIIGLSQVSPHRIAGFSGGSEIILPGISGSESIAKINWDNAMMPTRMVFGVKDNPIRQEMDECANMVNLSFTINCVPNPKGKICYMVAGHYHDSFIKACELSEKIYGSNYLHESDITIVDSYPYEKDLWSASKALFAAELITKRKGVIIFISPCREGISKTHKFITEYGFNTVDQTLADFESGKIPNATLTAFLIRMGRLIRERNTCIMVKNHIPQYMFNRLGFQYAETPQDALDKALFIKGHNAKISILKSGGLTLPIHILKDHFKDKPEYY